MSIIAGIGWHMVGAASAASFYAPIEKVKKWSWETTWAVAGFFSWILLPIGVSYLLLPQLRRILRIHPDRCAVEGRAVRRHVGRGQCELRAHHALPGHVAGDRRGHRRHAGRRHAGAAADARPGGDAVSDQGRPVQHGGRAGGADRGGRRVVRGPSEGRTVEDRRALRSSTCCSAWGWPSCAASSLRACRLPWTRRSPSSRRRRASASATSTRRCPPMSSSWAAAPSST